MSLMLHARWEALKHIRFIFPRPGCRIWRYYESWCGIEIRTKRVFCQCGKEFH